MKITAALAALSAASLIWAAPAQDDLKPADRSIAPVPGTSDFDAAEWAEALRDTDLDRRRRAYEEVLERARSSDAVYETVKAWAEDTSRVELAWTAQLLLRELDADPFRGLFRSRGPGRSPFELHFGQHRDLFGELEDLLDLDPFGSFDPWERFDTGRRGRLGGPDLLKSRSTSKGVRIEQTPDGVRVEVTESVDGEEQVETYEAESMEQLLRTYPDLEEKIGGRVDLRLGGVEPPLPEPGILRPLHPRTDRLGVQVLGPADRTRSVEGVPEDLGLEVVEVLPGTLADLVGVRVGEIVVAIDGQPIASPDDVKRALAKREPDAALEVEVVDPEGKRRVRTWKPAAKEARRF